MGALNRSLRVVQAAPASHFDRSAGCLREIHSERLTGHCFLHPRAKRGGSCPTTDPEITEKLLRCHQDRDPEKNPEEVKVLRGNPHQVADVADALQFEHKYTSGVIAWAPEDNPSELQGDRRSIARGVNAIWKQQQQARERQRSPERDFGPSR